MPDWMQLSPCAGRRPWPGPEWPHAVRARARMARWGTLEAEGPEARGLFGGTRSGRGISTPPWPMLWNASPAASGRPA